MITDLYHSGTIFSHFFMYPKEEFEDTKGVIRICISKKNRQHNGQKKKYKQLQHNFHSCFL